jgi:hypothetical protein
MFIGGMVLGVVLVLALAWFIFIYAGKQENQSMKVIGYIIVALLVAVVIFGPMAAGYFHGFGGGAGASEKKCSMMSGGSGGGMMSGGMSCPMMSGAAGGGHSGAAAAEDPNAIQLHGIISNDKKGATLRVPMIDKMRDDMMKSDFFVEAFAKSAMEKPEFLAKLKAQITKAEEAAQKAK